MGSDITPVTLNVRDPDVRAAFERYLDSIPGFAIDGSGKADGLLIHEVGEDAEQELRDLQRIIERGQAREVFLTSRLADRDLLLRAMRAGVKEFFPQPLDEAEIRPALWRLKERKENLVRDGHGKAMVVDVMGAKAGAGVTTIAVNLAGALLKTPGVRNVVLVDLNVSGGDARHFLDLKPQYSWGEAMGNISRMDASWLRGILASHPSGLRLLPPPSRPEELDGASPERLSKLLSLLSDMFDAVILDGGDYLDELSIRAMEASDMVLLAVTQNLPYLASARQFLRRLAKNPLFSEDKIRIVANRHMKGCELTDADIAKLLGKEIFWRLPDDYETVTAAANHGRLLAEDAPKSAAAKSAAALAAHLASERGLTAAGKTLLGLPLPSLPLLLPLLPWARARAGGAK